MPVKYFSSKKGRTLNPEWVWWEQAKENLGIDRVPSVKGGTSRQGKLVAEEVKRLKLEAAGIQDKPVKDLTQEEKKAFDDAYILDEQVTSPEVDKALKSFWPGPTGDMSRVGLGPRREEFVKEAAARPAPVADMQPDAIQSEIAELEAELATLTPQTPEVIDGQLAGFTPPQAPELPGAEILENPLLKAIQDDVQRRVFAGQASRRRIAPTETAVALQNALMPNALNLGLTQQAREQEQQQQNISNLMRLFGMGGNIAAGQGTVGTTAAGGIGSALQAGGAAQAGGALGQAQAIGGGLTSLFGQGGSFQGLFNQPVVSGGAASELGGGLFGTGLGTNFANTVA